MKSFRTTWTLLILLVLCLHLLASPALARTLLGLCQPQGPGKFSAPYTELVQEIDQAFGDKIAVHSYNSKQTLLSMLTQFNKLDAALISQATYNQQEQGTLVALANVQISSGADQTNLVLTTRSNLPQNQQELLIAGYQDLLMSTEGLALLEQYATKSEKRDALTTTLPDSQEAEDPGQEQATGTFVVATEVLPDNGETKADTVDNRIVLKPTVPAVIAEPAPIPTQVTEPPLPSTNTKTNLASAQKAEGAEPVANAASKSGNSKLWNAHVDLIGKLGNERVLGEAGLFLPLMQNKKSMFFLDVRFQLDDADAKEGNFGVGYRQMMEDWVLGGYAFYDVRESQYSNRFRQWTLGAEALSEKYDARFNLYLADEKEKELSGTSAITGFVYSGKNLLYNNSSSFEKSLSGFDFEVGGVFPTSSSPEVRAYLGGYYFDASDVDKISGPKARLEVRFPDIFDRDRSLLEFGGEIRNDSERDTDYYFSARLRIPFGSGSFAQPASSLTVLEERMTERVVRDPDIVTTRKETGGTLPLTHNAAAIEIAHVNDTGPGGSGTIEDPYGTLTDASGANSDIVLLHADSVFDGEGYQMAEGQRLLGDFDGANHLVETDQLGTIVLPRASTGTMIPIVQNSPGYAITAGNNSEIANLAVRDSVVGIYANALTGTVDLHDINITGGNEGLFVDSSGGNVVLDSVVISDTASSVLRISGGNADVSVASGSSLQQNSSGALLSIDSGHTGSITLDDDIALSASSGTGLQFDNADGSYDIRAATVLDGSGTGIDTGIDITNGSDGNITFSSAVTINNPIGNAVYIDGSNATVNFTGGLDIETAGGVGLTATGGTLSVTGTGNSITTNTGAALKLADVTIGSSGITFDTITTGTVTGSAAIDIDNVSGGVFNSGDVTIAGTNAADAIAIETSSATFNFSNIALVNIDGTGVYLNNSGPVTINGGTIYNTASYGINTVNTSINIDGINLGDAAGIGNSAVAIIANNATATAFSISNSSFTNIQGKGLQVEAYNSATISSGTVTNSSFSNILYEGIDVWAHDNATITNVVIGDPSAATAGDVTISNTGEAGIYLTAGNDGLSSEAGTLNVEMNNLDISSSNADTNIWLEALGVGSATYSVANSTLDASASQYDNIYLLVDHFSDTDSPALTAYITGNELTNGYDAGLTADNYSKTGTLSLYLANNATENGASEPDFGFLLYNNSTGGLTLFNTAPYTDAADLLLNQGNTGGSIDILDAFGTIDITPLP